MLWSITSNSDANSADGHIVGMHLTSYAMPAKEDKGKEARWNDTKKVSIVLGVPSFLTYLSTN